MTVTYVKRYEPRFFDLFKRPKHWMLDLERNHAEAGDHKARRADVCVPCLEDAAVAHNGKHIGRMDKRNFYAMLHNGAVHWIRKSAVIKNP